MNPQAKEIRLWRRIDEEQPEHKQEVFYFFAVDKRVYAGQYIRPSKEDAEFISHIFQSQHGFLLDDVTYWMPRSLGDPWPEPPSEAQKATCLYHPVRTLSPVKG
jgi:hypothetical protein